MRMKLVWSLLVGIACICGATNLAAKSATFDNGSYTTKDKEYYVSPEHLVFIRPGLELEIIDVNIPADRQTEVTFRISDPSGLGLDRTGETTPGPTSTSFILSYIPAMETSYMAYTTRVQTSPITGDSAVQATTDSGGTYTDLGDGTYMYKFATVLPEDYDMDATHSMGMYARRDLLEFDLDRYVANEVEHFVPSGISAPAPRDIVTTETCNGRCHDPLAIHGGSRQKVELCVLCHNANQDIDPDTGNSFDMPLMVHKIHMGENLTQDYTIIGYRQGVHNYNEVIYPAPINDCETCHTGGVPTENFPLAANPSPVPVCDGTGKGTTTISWGDVPAFEIRMGSADGKLFFRGEGAGSTETTKWVKDDTVFVMVDAATGEVIQEMRVDATVSGCVGNAPGTFRGEPGVQHTAWLDRPARKACDSCHDYIDWETGEGHSKYEIAQPDDQFCSNCHKPESITVEFGMTVRGGHKDLYKSWQFPGTLLEFISVTNTKPGDRPTVAFSLRAKKGGLNPNELNRLRFSINGENTDWSYYNQEDVVGNARIVDGVWTYTFEEPLPMDASGSFTVGVEGRIEAPIDLGDEVADERDPIEASLFAFAIDDELKALGEATERRVVVEDYKCESCHANISFHGGNRTNANYCNSCHRPDLIDIATPAENVSMKWMIHKIHRGADLENGYVVVRSRGTFDFSHVEFSGDLRNCDACHVNNSQQLPLSSDLLPAVVPNFLWNPVAPESAACLSCHDGDAAAAHAASNTSVFGESCSVCHGEGKNASVDRVHAR